MELDFLIANNPSKKIATHRMLLTSLLQHEFLHALVIQTVIGCFNIYLHILVAVLEGPGSGKHAFDSVDCITGLPMLKSPKSVIRGLHLLLNARNTHLGNEFHQDFRQYDGPCILWVPDHRGCREPLLQPLGL